MIFFPGLCFFTSIDLQERNKVQRTITANMVRNYRIKQHNRGQIQSGMKKTLYNSTEVMKEIEFLLLGLDFSGPWFHT